MTFFQRLQIKLQRLRKFEYWPYLVFYFPMFFYGFYLAFRSRSLTYFTTTNPSMKYGGIMGESKKKILDLLPSRFLPKTVLVCTPLTLEKVKTLLREKEMEYPVVVKPDIGERGTMVEVVYSDSQLLSYCQRAQENIIVQEFIDYPVEIGVLYYRFPGNEAGDISSIVVKGFLHVEGDGVSTFRTLLEKEVRAFTRLDYLKNKFKSELDRVPKKGERKLLEPIGNHCRGTTFHNGNDLINPSLTAVFDRICKDIPGFYYGRFDLKTTSIEDLYLGRNIKILELNGVSSEPAHVYDPDYKLWKAYRDIIRHMTVIYKIANANRRSGYKPDAVPSFLKDLQRHFKRKKERNRRKPDFTSNEDRRVLYRPAGGR